MANSSEISEVPAAWQPYINSISDWEELVKDLKPKDTGCGPVYELGNPLPERAPEEFAIADMRDVLVAEPHYHPNGETEIYVVLSGVGKVVVGGKEIEVQEGSVVVTPPDTTHFTIPKENLVLGVINSPFFNPANYVPITETNQGLGFDQQQLAKLVEEAYRQRGLETAHHNDEPGKVYEPDRDIRMHFYTIAGSVDIKIEDRPTRSLLPHEELIIESNQLHEGKVGTKGWEYIVAWKPEELKQHD